MKDKNTLSLLSRKSLCLIIQNFLFCISFLIFFIFLILLSFICIFTGIYAVSTEYYTNEYELVKVIMFLISAVIAFYFAIKSFLQLIHIIIRRKKLFSQAIKIQLRDEPEFNSFLTSLCNSKYLKTRMPSAIMLHTKSEVFVTTDYRKLIFGDARGRLLFIGLPIIEQLSVSELRAIITHELAHFSGRDTLLLNLVNPFLIALRKIVQITAKLSAIPLYPYEAESSLGCIIRIILFLFIRIFFLPFMVFKVLHFIFSKYLNLWENTLYKFRRLREIRADCIATYTNGSQNFIFGLYFVIVSTTAFNNYLKTELVPYINQGKYPTNAYKNFRVLLPIREKVTFNSIKKNINNKSEYTNSTKTHPSFKERFDIVTQIVQKPIFDADNTPANNLFIWLEEYEKKLTDYITQYLYYIQKNIAIVDEPKQREQKTYFKILTTQKFRRIYAFCLDYFVLWLPLTLCISIATTNIAIDNMNNILLSGFLIISALYYILFECSKLQGTPGKILFKLRVENHKSGRISIPLAILRYIIKSISFGFFPITFPINFIILLIDNKKGSRLIHDLLTGVRVVQDKS